MRAEIDRRVMALLSTGHLATDLASGSLPALLPFLVEKFDLSYTLAATLVLGSAVSEYPLHRKHEDPDFATQSHDDHMRALADATQKALKSAGVPGDKVASIALDTTGSSVVPVGEGMVPLDDYYLYHSGALTEMEASTGYYHKGCCPCFHSPNHV